jgi:hypothetical protein
MAQESEAYQIRTYHTNSGQSSVQTITPLPTPNRIQPAPVITKGDLTELIDSLRNEMAEQQERFDNKSKIDAERTKRKGELFLKINELHRQLNETQAELDKLKSKGSVRDEFIAFAKVAEGRITGIAGGVYKFLLEKFSQERHEATYKELTPLLKEDVTFKLDRSGIRGLAECTFFATLHRLPVEQITDARIKATLEKVYTATEKLEKALEK